MRCPSCDRHPASARHQHGLLVKDIPVAGGLSHMVDTVADVAIAWRGGMVVAFAIGRIGQPVAPVPRCATIFVDSNFSLVRIAPFEASVRALPIF